MVSESVQQSGCNQIKPTSKEKRITNHGRSAKSTCWEDWPIDQLWTLFFCFLFHLFLSWVLFRKSHNNHSWKPFKSFLPLKSNYLLYGRSRLPRKARSNALTSIEREMWRLSLFTHPFLKRYRGVITVHVNRKLVVVLPKSRYLDCSFEMIFRQFRYWSKFFFLGYTSDIVLSISALSYHDFRKCSAERVQPGATKIKPASKQKRIANHGRLGRSTCWEDRPINQLW